MHPLHDKDLDRLSRNAAEHYEMDSGSSGWEQLEKRLDQELPQKKDRRRFLFWLFFIVVTTGGALTGLLINSQPVSSLASNRINAEVSKAKIDGRIIVDKADRDELNSTSPEATQNPAVDTDKKGITPVTGKPKSPVSGNSSIPQDVVNYEPGSTYTPANRTGAGRRNNTRLRVRSKKQSHNPSANISSDPSYSDNQPATTIPQTDKNDNFANTIQPDNNSTPVDSNATAINPTKPAAADSIAKEVAENKKPAIPHRYKQPLELGLVAGPDASMVSLGPLYKAGYNFGITVGYRFNDRWSVNTGAIYTRKYYQADSNTFHAPKHSYISYVDLDVLKGYCAMWDIPLNVRYDISFNDKRRFFASAGASTYLMKEQNYNYWFWQRGTGDYKEDHWGPGNDAQYVFSVLNLSAGYEKKISKHFSIQAEPYFKIPLKGMGYGTMKIGSYGMFFSLKYRPTFKAKQPVGRK